MNESSILWKVLSFAWRYYDPILKFYVASFRVGVGEVVGRIFNSFSEGSHKGKGSGNNFKSERLFKSKRELTMYKAKISV